MALDHNAIFASDVDLALALGHDIHVGGIVVLTENHILGLGQLSSQLRHYHRDYDVRYFRLKWLGIRKLPGN